jgi:predicted flap endonuclease-1-like 5' DNA nuclease
MKWFLLQSLPLALLAFGLGALFHRLTWKKAAGVSSSTATDVSRFAGSTGAAKAASASSGTGAPTLSPGASTLSAGGATNWKADLDARVAELGALKAEHAKLLLDRDAKAKELSALSFEHNACKTTIADRDASLVSLRSDLDKAKVAASAASSVAATAGNASAQVQSLVGERDTQKGRVAELEAKLASLTKDNDAALAAVRADYEGRFSTLKAEHEAAAGKIRADQDGVLLQLKNDHEASLKKVRADQDTAVAQLRVEHEGSLAKARDTHAASLAQLKTEHDGTLTKVRSEHTTALGQLSADHESKIQGFTGTTDKAVGEANAKYTAELSALKAGHEKDLVALRADHERLAQEVRSERDRSLSGLRSDHDKALGDLRRRAETAEGELSKARADVDTHRSELDKVRVELDSKHASIQSLTSELTSTKARVVDNLEVIEGVGPAMHKALNADGIRTFEAVANADESRLRSAIEKGGLKFAPSIPTWSKQAAYLVADDQEGFKAYTDYLIAGVDPAGLTTEAGNDGHYGSGKVQSFAAGAENDLGSDAAFEGADVKADDLLRVEGIGPKINEILLSGGVRTFRRLAAMSEDSLRAIVNAGGVSFIPSVGTWAAQGALLRDGDEAGFAALVEKLVAGRNDKN